MAILKIFVVMRELSWKEKLLIFQLICIPTLNCGHEPCDKENEIADTSGWNMLPL